MTDTKHMRRVAEAAGVEAWRACEWEYGWHVVTDNGSVAGDLDEEIAAHIALFDPPTVLSLLDEIDRLRGELENIAGLIEVPAPISEGLRYAAKLARAALNPGAQP